MFFLANRDANIARYDHMDSHLDSFTQTHTHTHMQGFGCYIQHFVSPMLEFGDMFFLANRDANVVRYDHMDPHLDSFTETQTHMLGFGCYIQHFVSPMLEFRMGFVDKP